VSGAGDYDQFLRLSGLFIEPVGVFYGYEVVFIAVNQEEGAGRDSAYPAEWRDRAKAFKPFVYRRRKVLISYQPDAAEMVEERIDLLLVSQEAEVSRAGEGYHRRHSRVIGGDIDAYGSAGAGAEEAKA